MKMQTMFVIFIFVNKVTQVTTELSQWNISKANCMACGTITIKVDIVCFL